MTISENPTPLPNELTGGWPELDLEAIEESARLAHRRRRNRKIVSNTTRSVLLAILVAFSAFPVLWMVISSLRPPTELFQSPPSLLPTEFTGEWYEEAFRRSGVINWFVNSFTVAVFTTLITTVVSTLAGYALSRYNYPGRRVFMMALITAYLFPAILLLMPLYLLMSNYGLVGSLSGLTMAHVAITLPLGTWLMKSFVDSIPRELEEAAMVDGCKPLGAFLKVTLPLLKTGVATTMLFTFILSWDEFLFASVLSQGDTTTVPVGIQTFVSSFDIRWGAIMAVGTIVTLPVIILFFFLQSKFEKGLTMGSVKG